MCVGGEEGKSQQDEAGAVIELTDGWYGINARLDPKLTQLMALGKIFPGQKLRILGAKARKLFLSCLLCSAILTNPLFILLR